MPPTTSPLIEHDTLPFWVMLLALPFILAIVILAPVHFPGSAGMTIAYAAEAFAVWLGVHAPVPDALKRKPVVAKAISMVSGGTLAALHHFLPLCTDPRVQAGLWVVIVLLAWLLGVPVTFGRSGQALPAISGDQS